jgi:hypothetical protein
MKPEVSSAGLLAQRFHELLSVSKRPFTPISSLFAEVTVPEHPGLAGISRLKPSREDFNQPLGLE